LLPLAKEKQKFLRHVAARTVARQFFCPWLGACSGVVSGTKLNRLTPLRAKVFCHKRAMNARKARDRARDGNLL
jgi:hypothetical protein